VAITFPWPSCLVETFSSQIFELEIHAYTIDVHKPFIMSFELAQLREAAENYTYHTTLAYYFTRLRVPMPAATSLLSESSIITLTTIAFLI